MSPYKTQTRHQSDTRKGLLTCNPLSLLVGARRFELPTPTTPLWCATRLRYAPKPEVYNTLILLEFNSFFNLSLRERGVGLENIPVDRCLYIIVRPVKSKEINSSLDKIDCQ